MIQVEQRLDYLDSVLAELSHAQTRTEIEMKKAFKSIAENNAESARSKAEYDRRMAEYDHRMAERDAKLDREKAERDAKLDREKAERDAKLDGEKAHRDAKLDREKAERDAKLDREKAHRDAEFARSKAEYDRRMAERDARLDREKAEHDAEFAREMAERDARNQLQLEEWRAESKLDYRKMQKVWGDMANRLGTVAEDVVAPNIPRLALEEFGFGEVEDLLVRPQRVSRSGERRFREYDVICAGPDKVIVTDVKSTPSALYILEAKERLADFFDFYPEYEGRQLIGMFASWAINEKLLPVISDAGLYGLAMGDETMDIVARPLG